MKKVFVDTSAWIAYFSKNDACHDIVSSTLQSAIEGKNIICTSNYVFDETVTRLLYDASWNHVSGFIKFMTQSIAAKTVVKLWVDEQVETESFRILEKYREHKLSFTDATTVTLVKRFNVDVVITLDSDFTKIGIPVLP